MTITYKLSRAAELVAADGLSLGVALGSVFNGAHCLTCRWFNRDFLGFTMEVTEDDVYECNYPASLLPLSMQGVPSEARSIGAYETGCPTWAAPIGEVGK